MATTTTKTPKLPTQRRMRANIRAELRAALAAGLEHHRTWYRDHHENISAWAEDHGVPMATACAMASNVSPGLSPAAEPDYLTWVVSVDVPSAENRPHGYSVPRGYAPMRRARETFDGVRPMPHDRCKTGNYARCIENPDDPAVCAIDVHSWRTTCGDPVGSTARDLASLTPTEYVEVRRAWIAVAAEFGMIASEIQAITWVYRRGYAY